MHKVGRGISCLIRALLRGLLDEARAQKTDFKEAIVSVYSRLAESLMDNQPYF